MFRGFYTAASGMLAQQRRTEMLTNNLSNANTPGYKADQASVRAFPEMLLQSMQQKTIPTENNLTLPMNPTVGGLNTGAYLQETLPSFLQGDIRQTERNTDIALVDGTLPVDETNGIMGTIMFTVSDNNGEQRYTRNGNFTLDGQGYLTTAEGHYVLDTTGNRILLNSEDFTVDENGTVREDDQEIAQLGIAYTANPYLLVKEGNGLFRATDGAEMASAYEAEGVTFTMQQGFVEGSNVDSAKAMTDMLTAYRTFEANQKILQAYDTSMQKTVNEVGRIG